MHTGKRTGKSNAPSVRIAKTKRQLHKDNNSILNENQKCSSRPQPEKAQVSKYKINIYPFFVKALSISRKRTHMCNVCIRIN